MKLSFYIFSILLLFACNFTEIESAKVVTKRSEIKALKPATFTRDSIKLNLEHKIENDIPLFAHILVPLCDNKNQGIVPVHKSLGDGLNLRTNLYWGAGYGIRPHFKRLKEWKLLKTISNPNENVLERVIFYKKYSNNAKVYLIADAYRGDRMKNCLEDYLNALSEQITDTLMIDSNIVMIYGNSDLIAFNGHNGLMDTKINFIETEPKRYKDAVAIACVSKPYFNYYLKNIKAYPLVMTTSLLPPEAYVMEAIIDNWALMKSELEISNSAGDAMHRIHKCGQQPARNMFTTGW